MRVVNFLIGSYGGAERFFVRLCAALAKRDIEQLLLINNDDALVAAVQATGLRHEILIPSRIVRTLDSYRVAKWCRSFRADVVVAWMNRAARRLPSATRHVNVGRLGGYYPVKNYRSCRYLIANTPGIVAHTLAQGWPADRIRMISNFTDPPDGDEVADDFGIGDDKPVLCALGRFDAWKGFDTLIEALPSVEHAVLLLAGQGEQEPKLRALSERCGVSERVRFVGWLDARGPLFRRADICVVPSHHEPLGNVVLEAWSAGCPVVAAASEGPSWLIESGKTGMLVPPADAPALADALNTALAAPQMRAQWATEARKRWEAEFTVDRICAAYIEFLGEVARNRRAD